MAKLYDFIELHRTSETGDLSSEVLINTNRLVMVRRHKDGTCTLLFDDDQFVVPRESYSEVRALLTTQPTSAPMPAEK